MTNSASEAVPSDLETPSSESSTRGLPSLSFPIAIGVATGLVGCGGGGGDATIAEADPTGVAQTPTLAPTPAPNPAPAPATQSQASRFLAPRVRHFVRENWRHF